MANEKGVWRTIGGRRVFIKEGQDLASAMKESGKFKSAKKFSKREELKKDIAHQVTEAEKNGNTAHAEAGKRELERLNNEEKDNQKWLTEKDEKWLREQGHKEELENKIKNFKPSGDIEDDSRRLEDISSNYFYDEVGIYNENIDSTATKWAHDKAVELNKGKENKIDTEASNKDVDVSYYDENGEKKTAKYNELKEKAKESFNKNQEKIKKMTDEIGIGKKELENNATDKDKVLEDFKNSDGSKENFEKALNKISEMEYNNEINPDEYKESISKIQKEYVEKNKKANEQIEKRLEKQNRYTESESIKEVKDKYMPERTKAVSQYQNGEIDRNELMKRFDGNEQRMKETFEQMGYTAPTKKNIDRANARHEEFMNSLKNKEDSSNKEQFSVSDLKKKAQATLPKEDIDTHEGDLYLKKTKESTELLNNMKDKDSGLLTTFKDQETGETWYDIPFANMGDDYKEKTTNDIMNEKIRSRGKSKIEEDDLPKRTEIKTQGTSNRKEVSDNIQAHILDYYTEDYTGENISPAEAFVRQMDAMGESNMWRAGQKIAEGGSYLIYNGDMADFLDELKINPKGKTFSEDKAFNMYTSLIGRESAKLYDRIQKNSYKKYMKAHPLSKMSFEEFKDMNKK